MYITYKGHIQKGRLLSSFTLTYRHKNMSQADVLELHHIDNYAEFTNEEPPPPGVDSNYYRGCNSGKNALDKMKANPLKSKVVLSGKRKGQHVNRSMSSSIKYTYTGDKPYDKKGTNFQAFFYTMKSTS